MRHRPRSRQLLDRYRPGRDPSRHFDDLAETRDHSGCDVERARRTATDDPRREFGDVIDQHVIPAFLAFAEESDRLACGGEPPKPIRPVAAVRVGGAVDEGRAQHHEWRLYFAREHDLAREMHYPVQRFGGLHRCFGQREWRIGIDRIGADVDDLRQRRRGRGLQHRCRDNGVIAQHHRVAARRYGSRRDQDVCATQLRREPVGGVDGEQIDFAAGQAQYRDLVPLQAGRDRIADKSCRADNDNTSRRGRNVITVLYHPGTLVSARPERRHSDGVVFETRRCRRLAVQQTKRIDQNPSRHDPPEIGDAQLAKLRPRRREHQRVRAFGAGQRVGATGRERHDLGRHRRIVDP